MEAEGSLSKRASQYVTESYAELKKVSWSTRQEAVQATIVTIIIVVFVAVTVALMDLVFRQVMAAVLS